ncbi:MAG: hypothetical protein ACTHN0_03630 [Aquihabitans sp.]
MGGQMPDVCPRCRAFLVAGRPDCPFCGAEGATHAPAGEPLPGPLPASKPQERAPESWLPPAPDVLQPAAPRGDDRRSALLAAGGVLAAVVLLGGLFLWGPGRDGDEGGRAAPAGHGDPMPALVAACRDGKPISAAAPFEPTPGRHRLEGVTVWKDGVDGAEDPERLGLEEGWNSPKEDGDVRLDELQLVACYTVTTAELERRCPMETESGEQVDVELWKTAGTLVIREAKTGKEVLRKPIAGPPDVPCSEIAYNIGDRITDHPSDAINALLRLYNDGTEPGLPVTEQIAQLCDGELQRVVLPEERTTDAVTVFARTDDDPFEVVTDAGSFVLPKELQVAAPEDAGTVLCVSSYTSSGTYGVDATEAVARTLSTGDAGQGSRLSSGDPAADVDAEGRRILPWTSPAGEDVRTVLTSPRSAET